MRIARYIAAAMLAACMAWGQSLEFTKLSGNYVLTDYEPDIDPSSAPISIVTWVKQRSGEDGGSVWGFPVGSNQRFYCRLNGAGNVVQCYTSDGTSGNALEGSITTPDNEWFHIAIVWNGDGSGVSYVNGVEDDTEPGIASFTTTGALSIGCLGKNANPISGSIESPVRIYSYALSAEQVAELYWPDARRLNYTVATNQLASLPSPEWPLANIGGTNMLTEITLRPNPLLPAGAAATNAWTTYDGQHTITPYGGPTIGE